MLKLFLLVLGMMSFVFFALGLRFLKTKKEVTDPTLRDLRTGTGCGCGGGSCGIGTGSSCNTDL
jgi:hypothetical protein